MCGWENDAMLLRIVTRVVTPTGDTRKMRDSKANTWNKEIKKLPACSHGLTRAVVILQNNSKCVEVGGSGLEGWRACCIVIASSRCQPLAHKDARTTPQALEKSAKNLAWPQI